MLSVGLLLKKLCMAKVQNVKWIFQFMYFMWQLFLSIVVAQPRCICT